MSPSQQRAVTAQPNPFSPCPRSHTQRRGPALRSIPESPFSREEDPGRGAEGFLDRAGLRLKTFGWSRCQAGAARKRREVTLSFLLALKLRADTANSTSWGIPSATAMAFCRGDAALTGLEAMGPGGQQSQALLSLLPPLFLSFVTCGPYCFPL